MATNLSNKKPLFGNKVSHALNRTSVKKKPNYQTKNIDGNKVTLSTREWKTYNKNK